MEGCVIISWQITTAFVTKCSYLICLPGETPNKKFSRGTVAGGGGAAAWPSLGYTVTVLGVSRNIILLALAGGKDASKKIKIKLFTVIGKLIYFSFFSPDV